MRTISTHRTTLRDRIRWLLFIGMSGLSACATPGETPRAQLENFGKNGFEIAQELRISGGLRSDFEEASESIEREEYARAIELLERVTEGAPYAVSAHINLGMAYEHVARLEDAEASMKKALALAPRHPAALNELGIILRRRGRFEEARQSYQAALRVFSDFHYARRNLAILCDLYLSDLDCAIENYEIYSHFVPDDETTAMWIVDLRNRAGR